ncbi:MAG TPA: DUF1552 domain-containing protein [Bryobacteraceae bacterium]|jgi:hypothetical protein|nr:DUF1552 domain-containing protein [Bryobacteraceae bacterium]
MNFLTKNHLSRRAILRGAGAAVALPLLDAMLPAQTPIAKTAAKGTLRAGFIYVPHGAILPQWTPIGDGADFKFSRILKPLEPFRDRVTVVTGCAINAENGHAISNSMWLNGVRPAHGTEILSGTTVDQLIANRIGQDTTFPSLELATEDHSAELGSCGGDYACAYMNTISWRNPTTPNPMELNPRVVFERLFGGDGATAAERAARLRDNLSLLDGVTASAKDLSKGLASRDRERLNDYLDNVREIERRIAQAEKKNSESEISAPETPPGIPDSFEEHAKLMFDLWALAFQGDITRVTTFMMARELSTRTYPQIGVSEGHHPVSHHQNVPEQIEKHAKINTYHITLFAAFLEKLRQTPDGDGNLLDHSMILYGSGMSNGNVHSHDILPAVIVGGAAGRLKGNRHVKAPLRTPLSNVLVSLLDKAGVPTDRLGDSNGRVEI